ncbi:HofP DNA utilization family protein [Erwinia sp. AnSW2-5]|uniref:HofP DNA utilization family protein n=1 Tax=Erwinia sp. AnSW2-5 TaxID=3367692 RepID=UPI00385B3AD2
MKIKLAWGLLLLMCNGWARDPFFPPNVQRCAPAAEAELTWRLLGLIGHEGRYNAWLVSPQHKLLWRQPGDPLPGTDWRIAEIDAQAITITTLQNCQPLRRLALKGRHNAQDALPVADADKPVISQTGSPLSRF